MQNNAKTWKIIEILVHGYSSKSTQQELSDEDQYDSVWLFFKNLCILALWTNLASALEGLTLMLLVANLTNTKWCKNRKNDWNPGKWVLILEYSSRAFQWVPTLQGLDSFQKYLRPCSMDESSLGIERVKGLKLLRWHLVCVTWHVKESERLERYTSLENTDYSAATQFPHMWITVASLYTYFHGKTLV